MILDIDGAGATAKFRSQTFNVARVCARRKADAAEGGDREVDPPKERLRTGGLDLENRRKPTDGEESADADEADGIDTASTGVPDGDLGLDRGAVSVLDSPLRSVQLPSSKGSVDHPPDLGSSFDEICEPSHFPKVSRTQYDATTWDPLQDECSQRGSTKMDAEEGSLDDASDQDGRCGRKAQIAGERGRGYSGFVIA